MYVKMKSFNFTRTNIDLIDIEALSYRGIPTVRITGLPDTIVRESFYRVSAALKSQGISLPSKKIIINIYPATMPKSGIGIDLAITAVLLEITGKIPRNSLKNFGLIGELDLNGNIKAIPGALAILSKAQKLKIKTIISTENIRESIFNNNVIALKNIAELIEYTESKKVINELKHKIINKTSNRKDFKDVMDQEIAVRAALVAATGMHNLLLIGAPGIGKTMIAERLVSILPKLSEKELLEINEIYSMAQKAKDIITERPFRSPHHSSSSAAILGGMDIGEVSLAHKGVLFLDEFSEFDSRVLNSLREPLEKKQVNISRVKKKYTLPADFILVAASNPCVCGNYLSSTKDCICRSKDISKFRKKLNGPLLSRFDIKVSMDTKYKKEMKASHSSEYLREKASNARVFLKMTKFIFNEDSKKFLENIRKDISYRHLYKIIKLSKTIAALEESKAIKIQHLLEAKFYSINPYEKDDVYN